MTHNIEERSRNQSCRGKAIIITFTECVFCTRSYPPCKARAVYYIVICGVSGSTVIFLLSHKRLNFRKNVTEPKKCVLIKCNVYTICRQTQPDDGQTLWPKHVVVEIYV